MPSTGSDRFEGVVSQWNDKGYGFITFADGRFAYVHNSECGGEPLVCGEKVVATVTEDQRNPGKWAARMVERLPLGIVSTKEEIIETGTELVEGTVAQWNDRYGFIHFNDGRRAYVHISECEGQDLRVGEEVAALVVEDPRNPGKWQAKCVQRQGWDPASPGEAGSWVQATVTQWTERGFGFLKLSDGRRAYVHNSACNGDHLVTGETVAATIVEDAQNPGKWAAGEVRREPGSETGMVSEWKEEGGYGFVMLDSGRYAYVHRSAFGGQGSLSAGVRLQVTTREDTRNVGKWCVASVLAAEPTFSGVEVVDDPSAAPVSSRLALGGTPVPASIRPVGGALIKPRQPSQPPSQKEWHVSQTVEDTPRCTGTVADWNSKGFGFLHLEDGRRAYVHNSECGGEHLEQGEEVSAIIVPDERIAGKWAAKSVNRGGAGEDATVSEWRDEGGFGFVTLQESNKRAFIHRSAFGGVGSLTVGGHLRVTTRADPRNPGKLCVDSIVSADPPISGLEGEGAPPAKRARIL